MLYLCGNFSIIENKNDPKRVIIYFGSPNQIVNSRRAGARGGTLSARKIQTALHLFSSTSHTNCTSSNLGC